MRLLGAVTVALALLTVAIKEGIGAYVALARGSNRNLVAERDSANWVNGYIRLALRSVAADHGSALDAERRLRAGRALERRLPGAQDHALLLPGVGRPTTRARLNGCAAAADANSMFDIDAALMQVLEREGSDLHLKVPARPTIRRHGKLEPVEGSVPLRPEDTEATLHVMLTDEAKLDSFRSDREVDFSYSLPGVARFRVNAFVQRGSVSLVARAIPFAVKTVAELLLPPVISEIADEERGLVLLTGTTGSGKSTTLAAMIDHINSSYAKHIVTIEDPVEFLHNDKFSIINQREVGEDTASFSRALRRVLRQDPDVILVGEMRDEETVRTALSAAETGHLVLSTIHTVDAAESVNRIIDFFPEAEQRQARAMLAGTLKAVISQRLVPSPDGARASGHLRDPADDRPRARHDHEPRRDRQAAGGHLRGRLLRDADLRSGPARPRPGRPGVDGGRAQGGHPPSRLQAAGVFGRPAPHLGRVGVRRRPRGGRRERLRPVA